MSVLVRDEADIIEANIRHHARLGVSQFIVTDNGSVDGTREILECLSSEFDLSIIDEPSKTIDQDLWVMRMANVLREKGSADWVINNDADEFWLSKNNLSLPDAISEALSAADDPASIGVLYCPRSNYVASREAASSEGYSFRKNNYRVISDWSNVVDMLGKLSGVENTAALLDKGEHVIIRTLSGKVITRLVGLSSISMGNHGAKHALEQLDSDLIEIAHFPIRSFEQFERKVINYGSSIENNDRFGPKISLHLRRWYKSHKADQLQREYELIVLPEATFQTLIKQGVLKAHEASLQV